MPVEPLPPRVPHPPHRALRRCHRENGKREQGAEADQDELPLCDVGEHRGEVEELVDPEIEAEVKGAVREGEQPEHPPDAKRPLDLEDEMKRRAGEGCEQERQRPEPEPVQDLRDGIGSKAAPPKRIRADLQEGDQGGREDDRLQGAQRGTAERRGHGQKFFLRSIPE